MTKEMATELWSCIRKRLPQPEVTKMRSLLIEYKYRRIGMSQLLTSALPLLEKHDDLRLRFKELADKDLRRGDEKIEDELADKHDNLRLLFKELADIKDGQNDLEEGEIREDRRRGDENPKEDSSTKKQRRGRILHRNQIKKAERYQQVVTPSYKVIPKEEQSPVSNMALNTECFQIAARFRKKVKKPTKQEKAMEKCEDEIYQADMLIKAARSARRKAKKVMRGKMRKEDLGVEFYKCYKMLFRRDDIAESVRKNPQEALRMIRYKLKQKVKELKAARDSKKSGWKKVFEVNSAKQKDPSA